MTAEDILALLVFIFGIILFILAILGISYALDKKVCNDRFATFEHKYGLFSGCLIKINDKWIPDESYYLKEDFGK